MAQYNSLHTITHTHKINALHATHIHGSFLITKYLSVIQEKPLHKLYICFVCFDNGDNKEDEHDDDMFHFHHSL
jgi:hypothetical protein